MRGFGLLPLPGIDDLLGKGIVLLGTCSGSGLLRCKDLGVARPLRQASGPPLLPKVGSAAARILEGRPVLVCERRGVGHGQSARTGWRSARVPAEWLTRKARCRSTVQARKPRQRRVSAPARVVGINRRVKEAMGSNLNA